GLVGVELEPIASRGDLLTVLRRTWLASDYEMTSVCLVEVDDEGRAVFSALWDGDEVDAAMAELEQRFLAGEGAAHADWLGVTLLVMAVDAEGRARRIERFAVDDLDAAWARYRELGGQP